MKVPVKKVYFDMDGTLNLFYDVPNWLDSLKAEQTRPYREAKSALDMRELGKVLNELQHMGYTIGVISCTSKNGSDEYNQRVAKAKKDWLNKHIGAVHFDEIHIIDYYMPKFSIGDCSDAILFDDEERHRKAWTGKAYDEKNIIEVLNSLLTF